jgi:uncharacterized protein (TIGR02246 family)
MRTFVALTLALAVVFGVASEMSGGSHEELQKTVAHWLQAFQRADAEAIAGLYAEDAVFLPAVVPFRIEGRQAIREYWARFFETNPDRRLTGHHGLSRMYNNGTLAANTGYYQLTMTDKNGRPTGHSGRTTTIWAKSSSGWQIVSHHNSVIPSSGQ